MKLSIPNADATVGVCVCVPCPLGCKGKGTKWERIWNLCWKKTDYPPKLIMEEMEGTKLGGQIACVESFPGFLVAGFSVIVTHFMRFVPGRQWILSIAVHSC